MNLGHRLGAAAAAVALTVAACGVEAGSGDGPGQASLGTTPTTVVDRSNLPDDVLDDTFGGLGDPRIDVSSYAVEITTDDGSEIEGRAELVLRSATGYPLPSFTLDLRGPEVTSLTVDGEEAAVRPTNAPHEIEVTPAAALEPNVEVTVEVAYEGEPDQTLFPALGMSIGWQDDGHGGAFTMSEPNGTSTWVPTNDHLSDKATWMVTLDVPEGTTGVASGRLQGGEPTIDGGRARWTWVEDTPMSPYLVLAAVGDYELTTRSMEGYDDLEAVFAVPTGTPDDLLAKFDEHDEIIPFFEDLFGPYPNDDTGAIVVPANLNVAFESQTRSLFGRDAIDGASVWALPHEIAHQWFGNSVTPELWEDLWLNEGFATYADWLWRDHTGIQSLDDQVASTVAARAASGIAVRDPAAAATFDLAIYEGGALVLHALRLEVGDEAFFATLKRWANENTHANATTEDFVALASDEAGVDLTEFFDAWLEQVPPPDLPE